MYAAETDGRARKSKRPRRECQDSRVVFPGFRHCVKVHGREAFLLKGGKHWPVGIETLRGDGVRDLSTVERSMGEPTFSLKGENSGQSGVFFGIGCFFGIWVFFGFWVFFRNLGRDLGVFSVFRRFFGIYAFFRDLGVFGKGAGIMDGG